MQLSNILAKATSTADLSDIFKGNVRVELGCWNDSVTVEGYEGSVSTDTIASAITHQGFVDTEESRRLAGTLAEKVFLPLKKLVDDPKNSCHLYQLAALARIGWTPSPAREFGRSVALKHAMCLGCLDEKKYFMG